MSKGFASNYRIVLLATGLFVAFGALGFRLVWLHVIDREALLKTITKVREQLIVEKARRGDIRDSKGAILATSQPRIVLGLDPWAVKGSDEAQFPQLAALIGIPVSELQRVARIKYREVAASPHSATLNSAPLAPVVLNLKPASERAAVAAPGADAAAAGTMDDEGVDAVPDEKGRRRVRWVKLKDDLSEELNAVIQKLKLGCITSDRVYRRAYPNKELAAHLLGYVNREEQPVAGIEKYADFYLRGQDGWRVGERDGLNRELAQFRRRRVPPAHGYTVSLTIDTRVQDIVEQELAFIAGKFEPLKATIVVSDPRDGFILGMGNYPTFNPNEYNKVPKAEEARMKNVAVTDVYEPGSVFKIVAAAAALEERLVAPYTVFDCTLEKITRRIWHKGQWVNREVDLPDEDHRMGRLTVSQIISHSSNKGAAQLADRLGDERFYRYVRAFGFGARLGFPVGGEVAGLLNPYKEWVPVDITRIAMGHSVSSTVLQMHQAMGVIASGGVLLKPQLLKQVTDPNGDVVYQYDRREANRVVSAGTAAKVAEMLMGVASTEGTAREAAIPGFDVAGKTGTTQKLVEEIRPDGTTRLIYSQKQHVASFVGFFPAAAPEVVISVIVDEAKVRTPPYTAYGRIVAAPSFKRLGERLIPVLNIKSHSPRVPPGLIAVNEGGPR